MHIYLDLVSSGHPMEGREREGGREGGRREGGGGRRRGEGGREGGGGGREGGREEEGGGIKVHFVVRCLHLSSPLHSSAILCQVPLQARDNL